MVQIKNGDTGRVVQTERLQGGTDEEVIQSGAGSEIARAWHC